MLVGLRHRAGVVTTPHTLRQSFEKNLVDRGVPLDQVATRLGYIGR
ncbi:MAG TPA: hypothetical protein VJ180_04130 [Pyrinomonadaceae bacterium]|nr:hypothetical protein [Pyrinomonadaceae bacterium]